MKTETVFASGALPFYIIVTVLLFAGAFAVVAAILRASQYPSPAMLVVSLSVLTLATIVGYLLAKDSEMLTLTGVGLGALAGAVNAVFNASDHRKRPPKKDDDDTDA